MAPPLTSVVLALSCSPALARKFRPKILADSAFLAKTDRVAQDCTLGLVAVPFLVGGPRWSTQSAVFPSAASQAPIYVMLFLAGFTGY